jgi:hypothetical protein
MTVILPYWLTPSELGSYPQSFNFGLIENSLTLNFYSQTSAIITVLNGELLEGLSYTTNSNSVVITGEVSNISTTTTMYITFRITDSNDQICDRTFFLTSIYTEDFASWSEQETNFGYISAGNLSIFNVQATTSTTSPIIYGLPSAPAEMYINGSTGQINFTPPSLSANTEQLYTFTVNATIGSSVANLDCTITSVSIPHAPVWITPAGVIASIAQGRTLEVQLAAFDSQNENIFYSLESSISSLPFNLNEYGLIWGVAPNTTTDIDYEFTITATSPSGSTNQTFIITVTQFGAINNVFTFTNPTGELGSPIIDPITGSNVVAIHHGQYVSFNLSATSPRTNITTQTNLVTFGISGGMIPPVLYLDHNTGILSGFLDYTTNYKDYWFNISAYDGVSTIIQQFHILVVPGTQGMFMDISVPLHGPSKLLWDNAAYGAFNGVANTIVYSPTMNVVKGIALPYNNIASVYDIVSNTLVPNQLRLGQIQKSNSNITTATSNNVVYYSTVIDPQLGSSDIIEYQYPQPSTIISSSINSWRDTFISNFGYVGAGSGNGAILSASVNIITGGISTVSVIEPGENFLSSPIINISGDGAGAVLNAYLSIVSATIVSSSNGWIVGQTFSLNQGIGPEAGVLQVSTIADGVVSELSVINAGSYTLFPYGIQTIQTGNLSINLLISLGINSVNVISSGSGYTAANTTVIIGGGETLPVWQLEYAPVLEMATVDYNTKVSSSNVITANSANGSVFSTNQLLLNIQGKMWLGDTSFNDLTSFDFETTNFLETLDPTNGIFDHSISTFDLNYTTFDGSDIIWSPWGGTTIFEYENTIFDLHATIFEQAPKLNQSTTLIQKLIRMKTPQIRGNNRIDVY